MLLQTQDKIENHFFHGSPPLHKVLPRVVKAVFHSQLTFLSDLSLLANEVCCSTRFAICKECTFPLMSSVTLKGCFQEQDKGKKSIL